MSKTPPEIQLIDKPQEETVVVKKKFVKMVISTENELYKDFKPEDAKQTEKFLGVHIFEFIRPSADAIPEIFTHLFDYYRLNT